MTASTYGIGPEKLYPPRGLGGQWERLGTVLWCLGMRSRNPVNEWGLNNF